MNDLSNLEAAEQSAAEKAWDTLALLGADKPQTSEAILEASLSQTHVINLANLNLNADPLESGLYQPKTHESVITWVPNSDYCPQVF